MVRLPEKDGYGFLFEAKDLDKRLKTMDFHIESAENRQAFRAFLEFIQRESVNKGLFK